MATSQDAVISVRGATVRFGDEVAVDDVSFEVAEGTIFGFIGPSGSGKTTTIRVLTGVLRPTEGEVRVLGMAPSDFTADDRAEIGYMPQQSVLYPHLSVWENLNFAASMYGLPLRRRKRLRQVLELVELNGHERKLLRNTSGGMQRRLALAATLLHDPPLLFLDEPTAGIDPVLRRRLWDHFERLRDQGHTLFVTTQYVGEAEYCDRIGVLAEGAIVAVDTPRGLRRRAYGGETIELTTDQPISRETIGRLCEQPWVRACDRGADDQTLQLVVDDAQTAIPAVQDWFEHLDARVASVHELQRPFDDVFVELVRDAGRSAEVAPGPPAATGA